MAIAARMCLFAFIMLTQYAEAAWSPPCILGVNEARNGSVSVDAQGNAYAIWISSAGEANVIQSAILPVGGAWTIPTTLSPESQNGGNPLIAVDPQGNAVALWTVGEEENAIVQAATLAAGAQKWIAADHDLTPSLDLAGNAPQLAIDADGNALAIWAYRQDKHYFIQGARLKLGSSVWSTFDGPFGGLGDGLGRSFVDEIHLALNPSGKAVITWRDSDHSFIGAVLPADATKFRLTSKIFSTYQIAWDHTLGIDSEGNAVILFGFDKSGYTTLYGATLPTGSYRWIGGQKLGNGNFIQLAVGPSGYAAALWLNEANSTLYAATLPIGSSRWSDATAFSEIARNGSIQVAIDKANNAYAFWVNEDTSFLQVASKPYSGKWSSPAKIASIHLLSSPSIAFSSKNRCTIVISGETQSTGATVQALQN